MLRTRIITAAICLGVGAFVPAARSAPIVNPTVYSSLAGFQDQLQAGFYSEDFAALGAGNQGASLVFTGPAPSNGYSLTASVDSGQLAGSTVAGSRRLTTSDSNEPVLLTFTGQNVTAFAGNFFYINRYAPTPTILTTGLSISLTLDNGTTHAYTLAPTNPPGFLGFTSSAPIVSLLLTPQATSNVWLGLDNLLVGQAVVPVTVPEPSSLALGLLGLLGLAAAAAAKGPRGRGAQGPGGRGG